jgi:hypothetical protein
MTPLVGVELGRLRTQLDGSLGRCGIEIILPITIS